MKGNLIKMKTGKYYIGDPCYVLDEENGYDWATVLDETHYLRLYNSKEDQLKRISTKKKGGEFTIKGIKIACYSSNYGDGCYKDNNGNEYGVDSGCIACIPIELLPVEKGEKLGNIHEFHSEFTTDNIDNGILHFGDVIIDTVGSEEDDEDY